MERDRLLPGSAAPRPDALDDLGQRRVQWLSHVDGDRVAGEVPEPFPAVAGGSADAHRLGAKRNSIRDPRVARVAVGQAEGSFRNAPGVRLLDKLVE